MDSKTKTIIEQEMTISEIEKKWHCDTDRAVKLFCKALGIRKPNTDKLDSWSKHQLKKFTNHNTRRKADCGEQHCSCDGCQSCHGSCNG